MQWDAGVFGRRLTAAENAIDEAVLSGRRDHRRANRVPTYSCSAQLSGQRPMSCWSSTAVAAWGRHLRRTSSGGAARSSRGQSANTCELLHDCSHVDACAWFVCSVLCAS